MNGGVVAPDCDVGGQFVQFIPNQKCLGSGVRLEQRPSSLGIIGFGICQVSSKKAFATVVQAPATVP